MQSANILSQGYLLAFATMFVGGFLTSLTPCVYPLISVTVSIFGARGEDVSRRRAMLLASCYVGGIATTYTSLGIGFALTGREFNFGSFLGSVKVILPLVVVFFAMAASMFGAFELSLPTGLQTRLSSVGGKGFAGAFLMGLVGGIIAAPCTGPVLASILVYVATTRSVVLGGSLLFTYALGMGVLFFAVAAFARSLPKSGAWMDAVKSVLGVVMVVVALYFLRNVWPALAALSSKSTLFLVGSLVALGVGVAVGGLTLTFHGSVSEKVRKAAGVTLIVVGVFGVLSWKLTEPVAIAGAPEVQLHWTLGEKAGVALAREQHRPAFLDFYADWCLPCKEMALTAFVDPAVARELQRFQLIKVDSSSDEDPVVVETQRRYGAATLPTLVLIDSSGKVVKKIDHRVEAAELLAALREVK